MKYFLWFRWLVFGLCLGIMSPGSVWALEEIHLQDLIDRALERNPEIVAAKSEWMAAKNRVWSETALPDPMAGYDLMGSMTETRVGPQENRLMVSQEVPFPLKLIEKGKAASRGAEAAKQKYFAMKREVVNRLTQYVSELYFTDESIAVIEETKEILKKFESVAQAEYASRSGSQRDVAKSQAEVSLSLEKLFMLERRREIVAAMILAVLNEDPMTTLGRTGKPELRELSHNLIELVNLAQLHSPEIREMEAMAANSHIKKRLAWLANIPDLEVGFQYTWVGKNETAPSGENGRDSWMFPLRINVPIWQNRIIADIKAAGHEAEAADARAIQVKNEIFYKVKDAYHRYQTARKLNELYETAIIPQSKLAFSSDQAGYESRKTDFLNLLDSERVYLNAKLSSLQFYTEAIQAYSDLERVSGLDLQEEPKTESEVSENEN